MAKKNQKEVVAIVTVFRDGSVSVRRVKVGVYGKGRYGRVKYG